MTLLKALMEGHDLARDEAKQMIEDMRRRVLEDNEDPEEVLYEEGLEPDYILDLI
jgi:hypothetical protein